MARKNRLLTVLGVAAVAAIAGYLLFNYIGKQQYEPTPQANAYSTAAAPAASPTYEKYIVTSPGPAAGPAGGDDTLTICSFNIQNLGLSKMKDPEVMGTIGDILEQCDITAVQEVSDVSGQVMAALVYDTMNSDPDNAATFDFELSPRIGLNRSSSNAEQYAFVYDADKVAVVRNEGKKQAYVYPDGDSGPSDIFAREPYIVEFKAGRFDFALGNIHTQPDDPDTPEKEATKEICALTDVIKDAQERLREPDVIMLGDFNGDGKYFDENSMGCLKAAPYHWIISDELDTTVAASSNTYDRIVFLHGPSDEDFAGMAGVFNYNVPQPAGSPFKQVPTSLEIKLISDHYPIWGLFFTGRDSD